MIQNAIAKLIQYGLYTELIKPEDAIYTANKLIDLLRVGALEEETEDIILNQKADESIVGELESILGTICDFAYEPGVMEENSIG